MIAVSASSCDLVYLFFYVSHFHHDISTRTNEMPFFFSLSLCLQSETQEQEQSHLLRSKPCIHTYLKQSSKVKLVVYREMRDPFTTTLTTNFCQWTCTVWVPATNVPGNLFTVVRRSFLAGRISRSEPVWILALLVVHSLSCCFTYLFSHYWQLFGVTKKILILLKQI